MKGFQREKTPEKLLARHSPLLYSDEAAARSPEQAEEDDTPLIVVSLCDGIGVILVIPSVIWRQDSTDRLQGSPC